MSLPKIPYAAIAALVLSTSIAHAQAEQPASVTPPPQGAGSGLGADVEKLVDAINALENTQDLSGTAADATVQDSDLDPIDSSTDSSAEPKADASGTAADDATEPLPAPSDASVLEEDKTTAPDGVPPKS